MGLLIAIGFSAPGLANPSAPPGAPQYFSGNNGVAGASGSAMQVTGANGGKAAQLTSVGYGYGGVSVSFPRGTTFSQLTDLATSYDMTQGTCSGGAPRFQIDLGNSGGNYIGTLYAYIGPGASENGDPCPGADGAWATQSNVASGTDPDTTRWDASSGGAGGPAAESYAAAEATYGTDQMLDAQIVDDAGWSQPGGSSTTGTQQVQIENWDVNGTILFPYPGGNASCVNETLPAGTYQNVTAGQNCTVNSSDIIDGNLQVQNGGSLWDQGATVGGNLQASNASWIGVGYGGSIGGDLQVQGTTSDPGSGNDGTGADGANYLCNTSVGGNVQVHNNGPGAPFDIGGPNSCSYALNVGGDFQVQNNQALQTVGGVPNPSPANSPYSNVVQGNIQVTNNTGGVTMTTNKAGKNCQANNNSPAATGSGNTPSNQGCPA